MILLLIMAVVIKVCFEKPFSKKLYHIKTGQLICEAISKQDDSTGLTQRLGFKHSNTDFLKISCSLALPFRLSSSK